MIEKKTEEDNAAKLAFHIFTCKYAFVFQRKNRKKFWLFIVLYGSIYMNVAHSANKLVDKHESDSIMEKRYHLLSR